VLAYRAAAESRSAATEGRRALELHFQSGSVHVRFGWQDEADLEHMTIQPPAPPLPLWTVLMFREEVQNEYLVRWVDDHGHEQTQIVIPDGRHQYTIQLDGIDATMTNEGAFCTVAARLP
jgi:hypothetical protein